MEGLGALVIFVIFVVLSGLQRFFESREGKKKSGRPVTMDDLPERTRRMLYGPKEASRREERPARREVVFETEEEQGWKPVAPMWQEREAVEEESRRRVEPSRETEGEWIPVPAPAPVPQRRAVPQRRETRPTPPPRPAERREVSRRRVEAPQTQPVHHPKVRPAQVQLERTSRHKRRPESRRQTAEAYRDTQTQAGTLQRRARRARKATLFSNLDDFRRGVILSEVLGTPKGLRDIE